VDLSIGPDHIATRRTDHGVELVRVQSGDYGLLECFARHATLGEALSTLQRIEPAFDLGDALRRLLEMGMFAEHQPDSPLSNKGILP
jgi:hypothetical protein